MHDHKRAVENKHRCKNVQIKTKNVENVKNVTKIKKNVCECNKKRYLFLV